MSYFRTLPDVLYQSPLPEKFSTTEYIAIKNIFRKVKLASNIFCLLYTSPSPRDRG